MSRPTKERLEEVRKILRNEIPSGYCEMSDLLDEIDALTAERDLARDGERSAAKMIDRPRGQLLQTERDLESEKDFRSHAVKVGNAFAEKFKIHAKGLGIAINALKSSQGYEPFNSLEPHRITRGLSDIEQALGTALMERLSHDAIRKVGAV